MNLLTLHNYNLHWTLMGGQSFAWDFSPEKASYYGFTQDKAIQIKIIDRKLLDNRNEDVTIQWQTYPINDDFEFIQNYFRVNEDYPYILKTITKDEHIEKAIASYPNLRLLNQDFEQCLLSFILSSTKNIPAIRDSIRKINRKYGEMVTIDNHEIYLFPKTERILEAPLEELLDCKIGFRAKYMKDAAEKILYDNLSQKISPENEIVTRENLMSIHGVGDKIADCVMIFSLEFNNITPLDVWGKRVLTDLYKLDPKLKYDDMRNWAATYFEGQAAWAGQFLFEYIRHLKS